MENEIRNLEKKIKCLELSKEGTIAEYQYVLQKRDEKYNKLKQEESKKEEEVTHYKKEFEKIVKKLDEVKSENEAIKNSRWWKLRNKLKGIKE